MITKFISSTLRWLYAPFERKPLEDNRPLRLLMMYVDAKILYGSSWRKVEILPPNFYEACAHKVFPGYGIQCSFPPDPHSLWLFRWLKKLRIGSTTAVSLSMFWWALCSRNQYDLILGWHGPGVWLALTRAVLRWRHPRLCLILYRLYNPEGPRWKVALKRRIIAIASAWCELILTVAKDQATAFGLMLNRKPGTTQSFRYGVDVDFFNQLFEKKQATFKPRTIFCPGSAYRDEDVLLQSISDLEIKVTQYMLVDFHRGQSRNNSPSIKQVGKAVVSTVFNVPYQDYIKACLEANVVVISVYNKDKPAGLTALLECMALGRPVVITQGLSSRDYVVNGVTALEYCPGDAEDLKNKIRLLLETPGLAEALGQNAREAILKEYNLQKCGAELAELLWRVHETMQKED